MPETHLSLVFVHSGTDDLLSQLLAGLEQPLVIGKSDEAARLAFARLLSSLRTPPPLRAKAKPARPNLTGYVTSEALYKFIVPGLASRYTAATIWRMLCVQAPMCETLAHICGICGLPKPGTCHCPQRSVVRNGRTILWEQYMAWAIKRDKLLALPEDKLAGSTYRKSLLLMFIDHLRNTPGAA